MGSSAEGVIKVGSRASALNSHRCGRMPDTTRLSGPQGRQRP